MLMKTSVLNQPVSNGEDVRPVVRRVGSAEGRFSELERAVNRFEEEDDVLVPLESVAGAIDGGEEEL